MGRAWLGIVLGVVDDLLPVDSAVYGVCCAIAVFTAGGTMGGAQRDVGFDTLKGIAGVCSGCLEAISGRTGCVGVGECCLKLVEGHNIGGSFSGL